MADLVKIEFTSTGNGLCVECQGRTLEVLPVITMGVADVLSSIAPQLNMTKEDIAASFCSALIYTMDSAGELPRIDLSELSKILNKMKERGDFNG